MMDGTLLHGGKNLAMTAYVKGNLYGIAALVMWSTMIGLMRSVTEAFGAAAGTALIYTIGATALCLRRGFPKVRAMPGAYVWGCGAVFVIYELALSQAVGLASSHAQTLEVGMLNYLWPCLTIVLAMWINKQKLRWLVWPGIALSVVGIFWCLSSNGEVALAGFWANIKTAPVPYALGLTAAFAWGLYCNLSSRYARGHNAMALFFMAVAAVLWLNFFARGETLNFPGVWPVCELVFMGVVFGASCSLWETGIHQGNLLLLAVLSYFTPVASMLFICLWLKTLPAPGFWVGVGLVVGGSLLCWVAGRKSRGVGA